MKHIADELISLVEKTAIRLRSLDQATVSIRPSPDRWTIKEVIGHLIDSAANNHQRFVRAQQDAKLTLPDYQQNHWVAVQHYNESTWEDLIEFWKHYNHHLAVVIRHVRPESLSVICQIGSYDPVTLQFLIEDYVVHMRHHLSKIEERLVPSE